MVSDQSGYDLHRRLHERAHSGFGSLLDVGCGRGTHLRGTLGETVMRDLQEAGTKCIGIDVHVPDEPHLVLDDVRPIVDGIFPVGDVTVDVILTDWVIEHVSDPGQFFAECARVLKPGGVILARTLQVHGVASLGARLVPLKWHNRLIGRLQPGMKEQDVFPVRLACNSRSAFERFAGAAGLEVSEWVSHSGLAGYAANRPILERGLSHLETALPNFMQHAVVVTLIKAE